jgi:glycosyltransferase involved in cell wall biosynthesis
MAADLAEYAARNGYQVHVRCVSIAGPAEVSEMRGVTVHRYRRSFSLGRGVFSFPLIREIWRMGKGAGIVHAHMPYPESFLLSWWLGPGWRLITTFQCDAPMSGGLSSLIARALDVSESAFIKRADFAVASSADHARHSRLARVMAEHGGRAIPATSIDRRGGSPIYAEPGKRYVGFLGRPTSEKGVEVVLGALERPPADVCLLMAGPTVGLTEKATFDRAPFERLAAGGRIRALGFLDEDQIADFYASLHVIILPSTNSFEAFGIVQVEAMSAGTPVVASNLPGVCTIVQATGLGEIAATDDPGDLARCILEVLNGDYDRNEARAVLERGYLSPRPETSYLELYEQMFAGPPPR